MSTTTTRGLHSSRLSYSSRSNANLFEPVRSPQGRNNSLNRNNSFREKPRKSTENTRENTRDHPNTDRQTSKNETPRTLTLRETTRMTNESPFNGGNYGHDHAYNENAQGNFSSNGFSDEAYNFSSEKQMKKFLVEISSLQKELSVKDVLIEKLMKENGNLRKEMEEFLTAVDEAREYIDLELQESNQKIKDLETELEEAREETKKYKEMLSKRPRTENNDAAPKVTMKKLGMEVNNFYSLAQRETEAFYNQLNEQIFDFLNHSKRQFNNFSQNVQERFSQEEEPVSQDIAPMISLPLFSLGSNLRNVHQDKDIEEEDDGEMVHTETTPRHYNERPSPIDKSETIVNVSMSSLKGSSSLTSLRKNSSKKNFETTHSEELMGHELNKSLKKKKEEFLSGGHNVEISPETAAFGSGLSSGSGKPSIKDSLSPKSSLLRAKLRSDAILQEMKKKLAESTPH